MRIRGSEESPSDVNVMPLIDILFTLIIFFLATATFQEQEREKRIQLPRLSGPSLSSAPRPLIINVINQENVTKEGPYIVHTKKMDLAKLKLVLKNNREKKPDQKVIIRGDAKALHGKSTAALAACAEAGYASASIAWDTKPTQ